ncbi:MAG: hypothetical protein LBV79_01200 [Candidatus Adiutrix sp.]|jgi:threonine/homoserine/homoserine lactone efflux protein|nr:hypothetical protein [Candidatus Adiutrix sp.]
MPLLLIAGLAVLLLGLILFIVWFGYLLVLIKALLPAFLMAGGAVAAYLGWEEWRDKRTPVMDFSSPDEASRYTAEAAVYQAQINEIKSGGVIETEAVEIAAETEPGGNADNAEHK